MTSSQSQLNAIQHDLRKLIQSAASDDNFVGFSGGLDSSYLLHQVCDALGPDRVTAIHVHHGYSVHADAWLVQCSDVAQNMGCQFVSRKVKPQDDGHGTEAAARESRFSTFKEILPVNATLFLGHHLDDQIETFFLRLLRGAGIYGLKAMSQSVSRDQYSLVRPMLDLSRDQIKFLATETGLTWIEDESNQSARFDRNYLRNQVLPIIEKRWPKYRDNINRTIGIVGDTAPSVKELDLEEELEHRLSHDGGLKFVQTQTFSRADKLSLLHRWLISIGQQVPSKTRLEAILDELILAKPDAQPIVQIGTGTVRRHGPALYFVEKLDPPGPAPKCVPLEQQAWVNVGAVQLQKTVTGERFQIGLPDLNWRLRSGGEVIQPVGRSKSRDLKRLLQEYRVKPWLRDRIPLLYSQDELIAVGDIIIAQEHQVLDDSPGLRVNWHFSEKAD